MTEKIIESIKLDRCQYHPGEVVEFIITFERERLAEVVFDYLLIEIKDLDEVLYEKKFSFSSSILNNLIEGKYLKHSWEIPHDLKFIGLGLDISVIRDGQILGGSSTGFDVVEKWWQAPRYGFLATFEPEKADGVIKERLEIMKDFHINIVQFYDWMYRHHQLLAEGKEYKDIFGRLLSLKIVKKQIEECHKYGMLPLAYGAMYGAEKDFVEKHPDWIAGTRNKKGRNSLLDEHEEYIQIMNIAGDCPWREHIVKEYCLAVNKVGFAGIHIDQYGFPRTYFSRVNGKNELKDMGVEFGNFIEYCRREMGEETALIFNAVNNWPVEIVANKPQNAVYIEVWPPHETYFHLWQLIVRARELSGYKKQVILAAYISPLNKERDIPLEAGERTARLTAAAIFASGGFHLVLGEGDTLLTDAYYPQFRDVSPAFKQVLKNYYEVITRYSKFLFHPELRDKSAIYSGGINEEIILFKEGQKLNSGPNAEKDSVWTIVREKKEYKVLNLVNLFGIDTVKWDQPQYHDPELLKDIRVEWLLDEEVGGIYWITPDRGDIRAVQLEFQRCNHSRGELLCFTIPELYYWGFVVIKVEV